MFWCERQAWSSVFQSEMGTGGRWRVAAVDDDDASDDARRDPTAVLVEDSSDGTAWLVIGGRAGLRLEHAESGEVAREAYLVLSREASLRG